MNEQTVAELTVEDVSQPVWETVDDELFGIDMHVVYDSCGSGCQDCLCDFPRPLCGH